MADQAPDDRRYPAQRAFFECYPVGTEDIHNLAALAAVAPQTVYGWVSGHSRINRSVFERVIVPYLQGRYPDLDPELIDEVARQANPNRLRRYTGQAALNRQETAPEPAEKPTDVGDVLAAMATFAPLSVMLRSAKLTPDQRLALIRILSEGGHNQ